jgi:hypothetical protein
MRTYEATPDPKIVAPTLKFARRLCPLKSSIKVVGANGLRRKSSGQFTYSANGGRSYLRSAGTEPEDWPVPREGED